VGTRSGCFPDGTGRWLEGLAELVRVAITNVENRREVTASRTRLVAATDETRRRIAEELHDGPKQGLVSAIEVAGPPDAGTSVQVMIPVRLGYGVRNCPDP
jgi:signal transduction histidine kinase